MNRKVIFMGGGIIVLILILIGGIYYLKMANTIQSGQTRVLLETTKGNIIIELYAEQKVTSGNFVNLVNKGT